MLGLGSQVKGHIERRFGMVWQSPGPRMKEVVMAMREIWKTWQTGRRLDFNGDYYKLSLMTPFFSPGPIEHPKIPVFVAGVNEGMGKVAGEVGDGLHVHPLHTTRYLREVLHRGLLEGLHRSGRTRGDVQVAVSVFVAVGKSQREIELAREACREQVAFYASTRTYRKVMEIHGWGDVCERLHKLSVEGKWDKMGGEVGDEMLDEFLTEGTWDEIGGILRERYRGLADRVRLYLPFDGREEWKKLTSGFRA